jgi:hypothetical protein
MCAGDGPPALVISFDPMLEELSSRRVRRELLCLGRPPGVHGTTSGGGCPLASVVAAGASAAHTSSGESSRRRVWRRGRLPSFAEPPPVVAVPSPQPSAQELALLTPPQVGQPAVENGDETPTPREAAQRLARFLDEVCLERESPLIASPP